MASPAPVSSHFAEPFVNACAAVAHGAAYGARKTIELGKSTFSTASPVVQSLIEKIIELIKQAWIALQPLRNALFTFVTSPIGTTMILLTSTTLCLKVSHII